MSPFMDSVYDPCPCGFPCALYRRYCAMTWAETDRQRHQGIDRRMTQPILPFTRVWGVAVLTAMLALAGCAICTAHPYFNWAKHAPERAAVCGRK